MRGREREGEGERYCEGESERASASLADSPLGPWSARSLSDGWRSLRESTLRERALTKAAEGKRKSE